ncbi:hypothetical protein ACHQM5_003814 [Ranunculus cassubicifolius]
MSSLTRLLYRSYSTSISQSTTNPQFSIKKACDSLFKEKNLTKLVEKFKQSSEHYRFRTKHGVYQDTIRRLAHGKRYNKIEEVLELQKKYTDITHEGFANRIISLYGKSGMLDHAGNMFDEMPELKCERTVKSINTLLNAYVDCKKFGEVEKLFRELPGKLSVEPDEFSYTITIKALCELGSLDSARKLFNEMEKKGVKANVVTFNILLNAFYEAGRFLDGEKIWGRMEKKEVVPTIKSYNARLRGLVVAGKSSEAAKLFEDLKSMETKPDTFSYNVLIKGYCTDGKLDEAKKVYDELVNDPDNVENRWTYETLIPALCKKGEIDFALKLARKSILSNCFIHAASVQAVVDGLVKQSKMEDAEKFVKFAKSKSYGESKVKLPSKVESEAAI